MQTVLGLVIRRFDIHIKRETGCVQSGGGDDCCPRGLLKWHTFLFFLN